MGSIFNFLEYILIGFLLFFIIEIDKLNIENSEFNILIIFIIFLNYEFFLIYDLSFDD